MLTRGWEHTPLEAAGIVSIMPAATLAVAPIARRHGHGGRLVPAGVIALGGGLAALGLLPGASWGWTVLPQVLIGAGLGLTIAALTEQALATGGDGHAAAGTLFSRHAGVVLGLALLVPIFSADLESQQRAAERSGTALLLEARLPPETKVELGVAIGEEIGKSGGRLPQLGPAFRRVEAPEGTGPELSRLELAIGDQVRRAATQAFSTSFLIAAALALLTLVPVLLNPTRRRARV